MLARGHSRFVADETSFHMVDWLSDLHDLHALFTGRSRWTSERVEKIVIRFLLHVPNHVAAAAKVLVDFPVDDIFHVGAIVGSTPRRTARSPRYKKTETDSSI